MDSCDCKGLESPGDTLETKGDKGEESEPEDTNGGGAERASGGAEIRVTGGHHNWERGFGFGLGGETRRWRKGNSVSTN